MTYLAVMFLALFLWLGMISLDLTVTIVQDAGVDLGEFASGLLNLLILVSIAVLWVR